MTDGELSIKREPSENQKQQGEFTVRTWREPVD